MKLSYTGVASTVQPDFRSHLWEYQNMAIKYRWLINTDVLEMEIFFLIKLWLLNTGCLLNSIEMWLLTKFVQICFENILMQLRWMVFITVIDISCCFFCCLHKQADIQGSFLHGLSVCLWHLVSLLKYAAYVLLKPL